MVNRVADKESAKSILKHNGNQAAMIGMEILYTIILIMKKVFAELHRMQNYMVLLIKRARPDNSFISLRKQH